MAVIPDQAKERFILDWLQAGDPSIRWQTRRDLLGESADLWEKERQQVGHAGWGKKLLALRDKAGTWGGGIYGPKWTSTTYTLLTLRDLGLPRETKAGVEGAQAIVDSELGRWQDKTFALRLQDLDTCVTGMDLALLTYFEAGDPRVEALTERLLQDQMADGGWNCQRRRRAVVHSSLHTTINVLEGLADYVDYRAGPARQTVQGAMRKAEEFLLEHRLYKSDKTGAVIDDQFTSFSFPPRWHYDVLRGLEHFRRVNAPRDKRLKDAIELVKTKRQTNGCWRAGHRHPGRDFFNLEKARQPSRWNTLRALRILRWWERTG